MISKNHRQNSNFQILHFLAGSCHTPDAAYSLLCDQAESRQLAIENYEVSTMRSEAKRIRLQNILASSTDEAERIEADADLIELSNNEFNGKILFDAAVAELKFIEQCIVELDSKRKYHHLPDEEAHQLMQQEEWRLELIHRAENYLLTTGTIPTDHFVTMRMHPDFLSGILPRIQEIRQLCQTEEGTKQLLAEKPKLIELTP